MTRTAIATILAGTIATGAAACDQAEAEQRWRQAEQAGVILGAGLYGGIATFQVDAAVWRLIDLNTRHGMAETFQCIVAGPDQVLRQAQILDNGGAVLARWNGVTGSLEQ